MEAREAQEKYLMAMEDSSYRCSWDDMYNEAESKNLLNKILTKFKTNRGSVSDKCLQKVIEHERKKLNDMNSQDIHKISKNLNLMHTLLREANQKLGCKSTVVKNIKNIWKIKKGCWRCPFCNCCVNQLQNAHIGEKQGDIIWGVIYDNIEIWLNFIF